MTSGQIPVQFLRDAGVKLELDVQEFYCCCEMQGEGAGAGRESLKLRQGLPLMKGDGRQGELVGRASDSRVTLRRSSR